MKGPYECFCTLNESCTKLIWRDESLRQYGGNGGKVGQKRADFFSGSCCRFAFASVFSFLESIPGTGNCYAILADARHAPVSRQPGEQGDASGHSGSGRVVSVRAFLLFPRILRWVSNAYPRCLCCVLGRQALGSQRSCLGPLSQSDSLQRESWLDDDSTLSVLPFLIRPRLYYITVFDAIALIFGKSGD